MQNSLSKNILFSFKQLFSGEVIYTAAGFVAAYFYAILLGPEVYGTWQTANVFTSYSMLFALGLPFVMRRDFIQLRGEGKFIEANQMANQVFSYSLITGPIFSLGLFVTACVYAQNRNFSYALTTVGIINLFSIVGSYGDIMSKGFNQYGILRDAKILLSLFTLFTVLLVWKLGFKGLLSGLIIANIANSVYYYFKRPIPYNWYWNFSLLKRMIFVGFPIYLQNIVQVIFTSIDRLIIAAILSFKEVGYYSLSGLIKIPITLIVSSLGIVVFTQLNEKFGKDKSARVIKLHMEIPQLFVSYILSPLIVLGIMVLPYLVQWLLPDYSPGIAAAQIFVFAILFLTLAGFSSNALFILNKQKYGAIAFTIAGIVKTTGSILFLKMGYGINAVAATTLLAYFIYDTLMVRWVKMELREAFTFKFIIEKNLPVIYVIFIFILIRILCSRFINEKAYLELISELLFYIFLMIPYYFIGRNKISFILEKLRNE